MKKNILLVLLVIPFKIQAFEFKTGNYELVSGDEKYCEDGDIKIKKDDLIIGTRYVFPNFKSKEYKYTNDDKSCEYHLKYDETKEIFKQSLEQKCLKADDSLTREISFQYKTPSDLAISMTINNQSYSCLLRLIK